VVPLDLQNRITAGTQLRDTAIAGVEPLVDTDGDGTGNNADTDDDNDGLLDTVETNTGIFVDPANTGTDPLQRDSDGDTFPDGQEVAGGTDPNNSSEPAPVPSLGPGPLGGLSLLLLALGLGRLRAQRRRSR
jgi:hypothetical protein